MKVPKKKYLNKVRARLGIVREWFSDKARVEKMMLRVGGFGEGTTLVNKMAQLNLLLNQDVPAILDALEELKEPERLGNSELKPNFKDGDSVVLIDNDSKFNDHMVKAIPLGTEGVASSFFGDPVMVEDAVQVNMGRWGCGAIEAKCLRRKLP